MCGIFGMITKENIIVPLLSGIKKLEYRGYDSSGIAFFKGKKLNVIKKRGEINVLENSLNLKELFSTCGIAHTRWATHGSPSDENAHPHFSNNKQFALVHNGIIENFKELTDTYLSDVTLKSQTDTEVVVQLIEKFFNGNVLETFKRVCDLIKGSYAFCLLYEKEPNTIYVTKKESPLIVAKNNTQTLVASDVSALVSYTKNEYILNNKEYAILTLEKIQFFNESLKEIIPTLTQVNETTLETEKGKYEHFMLKEILEIPSAIQKLLEAYPTASDIYKYVPKKILKNVKNIKIIACGTAYHAGLVGKKIIETQVCGVKVDVEIASEFRYSNPYLEKNTLCLFVSQSGETADTIAALKLCKSLHAKTVAITNVKNSTITYEADYNLFTLAGREIAVASTKAYNSQLAIFYLLTCAILELKTKQISSYNICVQKLKNIFNDSSWLTTLQEQIKEMAKEYSNLNSIYLIGRQLDYATSQEASLKLKEITYIHCEAYPAGELKHGTLSLIESGTCVICFLTQDSVIDKTLNGLFEVNSRGASVLVITKKLLNQYKNTFYKCILLKELEDLYMPLISIIPIQLLAYYISVNKNINPDKPRNLAKSVTVE